MGRLLRYLLYLIILGALALLGYSYVGDMSPPKSEVTVPVTTDGG